MTKILCVIGTRPEAIKMAPVVLALRRKLERCNGSVLLLGTGQHREIVTQSLSLFGLSQDATLDVMRPGQDLGKLLGRLIHGLDEYLSHEAPQLVLAQGDTSSVLATAISCFYRRTPFAHVEAGLRTGSLEHPFPEEFHRRAAAITAEMHFAPTERSRAALLSEGVPESAVEVTGNTVLDAVRLVPEDAQVLDRFGIPLSARLVVMTAHRREAWGSTMADSLKAVRRAISRHEDTVLLLPVHPNPIVSQVVETELADCSQVILTPPLDYPDMINLLRKAHVVVTDSGGIQEEAQFLGAPILITRDHTERQEIVAVGAGILVGAGGELLEAQLARLLDDPAYHSTMAGKPSPYGDGRAADRIASIVARRFEV